MSIHDYNVERSEGNRDYQDSGSLIVFFEEDEGTRLETVWEARNVPKLGEGVLYHYM